MIFLSSYSTLKHKWSFLLQRSITRWKKIVQNSIKKQIENKDSLFWLPYLYSSICIVVAIFIVHIMKRCKLRTKFTDLTDIRIISKKLVRSKYQLPISKLQALKWFFDFLFVMIFYLVNLNIVQFWTYSKVFLIFCRIVYFTLK